MLRTDHDSIFCPQAQIGNSLQ